MALRHVRRLDPVQGRRWTVNGASGLDALARRGTMQPATWKAPLYVWARDRLGTLTLEAGRCC